MSGNRVAIAALVAVSFALGSLRTLTLKPIRAGPSGSLPPIRLDRRSMHSAG